MAKLTRMPPGMEKPRPPERLGSPALYAQRRLIGATGRAESEREGAKKIPKLKTRRWTAETMRKPERRELKPLPDKTGRKKTTRKRVSGK